MLPIETRNALTADIAAHLLTHGAKGWGKLREQYPQVAEATFWRYVKQAKQATFASPGQKFPVTAENPGENPGSNLHGAVCLTQRPAFLETGRASDLFEEFRALMDEAKSLRRYATDEKGEIRHPKAFVESVKLRERILLTGLRELENIFNLDRQQRFYDAITAIIVNHVPKETQLLTIQALERLEKAASGSLGAPRSFSGASPEFPALLQSTESPTSTD